MKIEDILALEENSKIINLLTSDNTKYEEVETYNDQYIGVHDILNRASKFIGEGDDRKEVEQARIVVKFQKKIVNFAVSFLFGAPVKLVNNTDEKSAGEPFDMIKNTWRDSKLDSHNKKLAHALFKETQVAEYYYVGKDKEGKLKVKVALFSYKNGDRIYPFCDDYGDMVAFTRAYVVKDENDKDYDCVDVFTEDQLITFEKRTKNTWERTDKVNGVVISGGEKEEKISIGKIPIVYYEQDEPEWEDVQNLIDKYELRLSKLVDTNDYFSSPAVVIKGKVSNMPEKGEVGKLFQIEAEDIGGQAAYGDIDYLTWDQTAEAAALEMKILQGLIHSLTQTPDLSFDNVKGIGDISGIAMKFLFLDSTLKAMNKQEIFSEGFTRRINILKAIHSKIVNISEAKGFDNLEIGIEFNDVLPQNIQEIVDMLYTASGAKPIMSQKSAVNMNPLVEKPGDVIAEIKEEAKEDNVIPGTQIFGE